MPNKKYHRIQNIARKDIQKHDAASNKPDDFHSTQFAKDVSGKPFWIADDTEHKILQVTTGNKCCFWHIVGLPEKVHLIGKDADGKEILETKQHPMYPYEQKTFDALFDHRYIRVKKAAGMGMTTFFLYLIAWLCVRDDQYNKDQMVIVTGPRLELASEELDRLEALFYHTDYVPKKVGKKLTINGCTVQSYPSHTFNTARGLERCRLIFADEADFFPLTQIETVTTVLERYEAKSHPFVILNSTTNLPGGLYSRMDKDVNSRFKTIEVFYKEGLEKIYSPYEIEQAKKLPSFEQEYNGFYGTGLGNIFAPELVDGCIEQYDLDTIRKHSVLAVDPAFGSSKFAMVGLDEEKTDLRVKIAIEFERPSYDAMMQYILEVGRPYGRIVVDSAYPGLIRDLQSKKEDVFSITFNTELSKMVSNTASYIRQRKVKIHSGFTELIAQLKAVRFNERGHPDKTRLSFDLGDAFLMAVHHAIESQYYWDRFG